MLEALSVERRSDDVFLSATRLPLESAAYLHSSAGIELSHMTKRILGKWKSDPDDPSTQASYGEVTQTFHEDGRLTYVIHLRDKDQVMRLVYKVDGDELVTDQPSARAEHRTRFSFDERGRLVLDDEGERSRFVRVK